MISTLVQYSQKTMSSKEISITAWYRMVYKDDGREEEAFAE